jgi:exoribonuclease II
MERRMTERDKLISVFLDKYEYDFTLNEAKKLADFIIEDRKINYELLLNAYHAVRSHLSYGIHSSSHLERCESNLKEILKNIGIENDA